MNTAITTKIESIPKDLGTAPEMEIERVTDWYQHNSTPLYARPGWYETRVAAGWAVNKRWWNGSVWKDDPDGGMCTRQFYEWRGLAYDPDA